MADDLTAGAAIYAQANKPTVALRDPQEQFRNNLLTAQAMLQARGLQMQMAGRQALSEAYRNVSIDPATGLPNSNQLIAALQSTPGGAYVLPDVIKGIQDQQKRQYDLNKAGLDQTSSRVNIANSAFNPLLRLGNAVTPTDIMTQVSGLHASGFPTDEIVADMAATMPPRQPGMSDQQYGAQLQGWLLNHASRSWGADTQAAQFKPNATTVDNGGQIITRDTNAYTNPGITSAAPIVRQLSPSEQFGQVKGPMGPNGQPTVIPGAAYAQQNGMGYLVPGGGAPQPSPMGTGRFPGALLNPNRQAAPAPGSIGAGSPGYAPAMPAATVPPANGGGYPPMGGNGASPTPQGYAAPPSPTGGGYAPMTPSPVGMPPQAAAVPMAVGLGPAQQAAAEGRGKRGQDAAGALFASAQDSPQRQAQISAMLGDLTKYGSGPNSGAWGSVRGRLVQLGVDPGGWAEGQAAQENFAKMSNQFLAKQASFLGPITNDKLALAGESGPNPMFTSLGNQGVLHIAQGNEDALTAKANAWAQAQLPQEQGGQGLSGADYQNWSTRFNQGFMPSAFWYARMSQPERQTLLAGMSGADQAQLHGAIVNGINQKWIDPSSFAMPAAGTATAPPDAPPMQAGVPLPLSLTGTGAPASGGY